MQQMLFEKEKKNEAPKPFSKPQKKAPSNVFAEELEEIEKEETFAAAYIRRIVASTLDQKQTLISANFNYSIKPYPQENSHYGGYYQLLDFSEEQVQELLDYLIEFRKRLLSLPYVKDIKNAYRYTNLKDSNFFIKVTDETKKFIEAKANVKWDDFLKKFNGIKNKTIPEGYNDLIEKELELEKNAEAKKSIVSNLKEQYVKRIDEDSPNLASFGKEPNEIHNAWKKAKQELAGMENELKNVQNKIDSIAGGSAL